MRLALFICATVISASAAPASPDPPRALRGGLSDESGAPTALPPRKQAVLPGLFCGGNQVYYWGQY